MNRKRLAVAIGAVVFAAGGVGIGVAVATGVGSSSPGMTGSGNAYGSMNTYYRSMMEGFSGSSMMGGSVGSKTDTPSYAWMMGGTRAPGWMHGGTLPASMMGTNTDPGEVMGRLFANAPGPRVSPSTATQLGNEKPAHSTVDAAQHRITLSEKTVALVALASPSGGPDETYRIAGLVNPTITVKAGTRVSIEVVNADSDTAHGLVITAGSSTRSWMPMMTAVPAFNGSALWFLGDPTSVGMHAGTLSFTATTPGIYYYLCAVPGHAQKGMIGTFVVAR